MSDKFNSKIKSLISSGHLVRFETVSCYRNLKPALLLYFDNHYPVAVEKERWPEYSEIITSIINSY